MEKNQNNDNEKNDKFIKKFFPQKIYHIHSDIDLWINISIIQLLNYKKLLGDKNLQFIQDQKKYNFLQNKDEINKEKLDILKKISDNSSNHSEKSKKDKKNCILGFEIPVCEIYFIVKLFIDEIEKKPEYQTKIIFNYNNINQHIPFKYKIKDLTEESYIIIEIYSVELPPDKSFLGTSKIYLFDKNLNLYQGRHAIKIKRSILNEPNIKKEHINNENEFEKEIEIIINSFYKNAENIYGEENRKGIKIKDSKKKIEEIDNNYFYNTEEKEPQLKTEEMKNYDWKLNELLSNTDNSYIVVRFPYFNNQVIYEEGILEDGKDEDIFEQNMNNWVYDSSINNGIKSFMDKSNPITDKIINFSKDEEIKLNPEDRKIIEQLLNKPDFFELKNKEIFWKNRYGLLRNDTRYALTKIMNSVEWGNVPREKEFVENILENWKTIELCDILYMLSRKFSINKIYINDAGITNNLTYMKMIRRFAIKHLSKHSITELNFILLQLVQAIRYENISIESIKSPLVNFLINQSKIDLNFASSFYWFIECESQCNEKNNNMNEEKMAKIYNSIKEYFKVEMKKNPRFLGIIENEIEFKNQLEDLSHSIDNINSVDYRTKRLKEIIDKDKKDFMHNEEHYFPLNPKIKIKGIATEDCKVFDSKTKPIKFTFKTTQETKQYIHFDDKNYCRIFFKNGDDLRQDQLILQIMDFMDSLLKKQQLDYQFTIYKVLATSKKDGLVEFVPSSKTYTQILKENNRQLQLYFRSISDNPEMYERNINNFINSLAGYCAVNYILGIGDRHDENIMFDKKGRIFHIDFGYILGKDPYIYFPFKITYEMIDCMGGIKSENYQNFKQKCKNAYSILRENARTIVNMFYLMIDSGIPEINNIESLNKLHEKFLPNLDKEQALNFFLNDLEATLNSILPAARERLHTLGKIFSY